MLSAETPAGAPPSDWTAQHDSLVARLRKLTAEEGRFGPAWQPIYHAALPWYERWGGNPQHTVDSWMSSPEAYATELADALEHGRNFFAENPGALVPLVFTAKLADGRTVEANYWLAVPAGFAEGRRTYPLIVGLHGSGWLGHKISFVRQARKDSAGGRAFTVTPINEGGPWQIDFLNAYLDELLRILPVDDDRVYVEGHSLGGMATWKWALNNPERFAAISPRSARGEPYRASRLRDVPAWVIHGEDDDVVFTGFADEMVVALETNGGRVRYSLLPHGGHNMPDDLDQNQVVDWYLRQTRRHEPVPADPRDLLGITAEGCSPWTIVEEPAFTGWKSDPVALNDMKAWMQAGRRLFDRVHARGERVDAPILLQVDPTTQQAVFWLAQPKTLHPAASPADTSLVNRPATRSIRFYFRGPTKDALAHAAQVLTEAKAAGHAVQSEVWIRPLSLWFDRPTYLAEYRLRLN